MMYGSYYDILSLRQFWHQIAYAPDGKRGFYCRTSQKKRRKKLRRVGKGR